MPDSKKTYPWMNPGAVTVEEHQDQLASAQSERKQALKVVERAVSEFDEEGTADKAEALREARLAAEELADHVSRAQRLLKKAEDARAVVVRAALEDERDELRERLSADNIRDERFIFDDREARLLRDVAVIRQERAVRGREVWVDGNRLLKILTDLGEPAVVPTVRGIDEMGPIREDVGDKLRSLVDREDELREYVNEVAKMVTRI